MTEHPILFSSKMVKAILDGRKTQTRRVIPNRSLAWGAQFDDPLGFAHAAVAYCPYGQVGGRLWVRETFCSCHEPPTQEEGVCYKTNLREQPAADFCEDKGKDKQIRWRPSIFMPRWASRILLEITEVRVQKAKDITLEDAIAEGFGDSPSPIDEFNKVFLRLNPHLKDVLVWVWAISFKRVGC